MYDIIYLSWFLRANFRNGQISRVEYEPPRQPRAPKSSSCRFGRKMPDSICNLSGDNSRKPKPKDAMLRPNCVAAWISTAATKHIACRGTGRTMSCGSATSTGCRVFPKSHIGQVGGDDMSVPSEHPGGSRRRLRIALANGELASSNVRAWRPNAQETIGIVGGDLVGTKQG